jgi:hypothetical protein
MEQWACQNFFRSYLSDLIKWQGNGISNRRREFSDMIPACYFLVALGFSILRKDEYWWHRLNVTTMGRIYEMQRKLTGWQRLAF